MGNFEIIRNRLHENGHLEIHPTSIRNLPEKKLKSGRSKFRISYGVSSIDSDGNRHRTTTSDSYESNTDRLEREIQLMRIKSEGHIPDSISKNLSIENYLGFYLKTQLREICDKYNITAEKGEKHKDMSPHKVYAKTLLLFLKQEGVLYFNELTGPRMKEFRMFLVKFKCILRQGQKTNTGKTLSQSSINKRINWFFRFIDFVETDYPNAITHSYKSLKPIKNKDPMLNSHEISTRIKKTRFLSQEEALAVFKALTPCFKVPFIFLVSTGCRKEKCFTLTDEEINLNGGIINLKAYNKVKHPFIKNEFIISRMKNSSKNQLIPMSKELIQTMKIYFEWKEKWCATNKIKTPFVFFNTEGINKGLPRTNNVYRSFIHAYNNTEKPLDRVDELDIHCLKRTFVNRLNQNAPALQGLDETRKIISLLAQHDDNTTTEEYYRVENMESLEKIRLFYDSITYGFDMEYIKQTLDSYINLA
jgi:integrase